MTARNVVIVLLVFVVIGAIGGWSLAVAQDGKAVMPQDVNPLVPVVGVGTPAGIGAYVAWWARGVREEATKKADAMIDLGGKVLLAVQTLSQDVRALGVKQDRSIVLQGAEVTLQEELAERVDEMETTMILALDKDPPTEEVERRRMLRERKRAREKKRADAKQVAEGISAATPSV